LGLLINASLFSDNKLRERRIYWLLLNKSFFLCLQNSWMINGMWCWLLMVFCRDGS
jgi:hypothetical protein